MLCDDWLTTNRLEHHFPETKFKHKQNKTKTTTHKQNKTTDQQTQHLQAALCRKWPKPCMQRAKEVQCHGLAHGLGGVFFYTRCEQTDKSTNNRQTKQNKTNKTDNTTNQSTTRAPQPELTIWKRCCGRPARGCSGPKPTSKLGDQPSMLCDDWLTTNRLEHHYPETNTQTQTKKNKDNHTQTEQDNKPTDTAPVGR